MVVYAKVRSIIENGFFGVAKPGTNDLRLVLDCRPVNAILRDPPKAKLPNAGLLPQLFANDQFWVAKSDLSDFYHHIALPPKWLPYFGLPPMVIDGQLVYPQVRSLPMGWSYSVLLAQMAHERIIERAMRIPRLRWRSLNEDMIMNKPLIDDTPLIMCYIDDVGIIGTDRDAVDRVQQAYIRSAIYYGFTIKPSKTVSSRRLIELLGVVVDGTARSVAPSVGRICNVLIAANALISAGRCTYDELASLVGKFNWIFLLRRPLLSVFNNVYHWLNRFQETQGTITLWESCAREIACAAGLIMFARADLSLPLADSVLASDASSVGYGVTVAGLGDDVWRLLCTPLRPPLEKESEDYMSHGFDRIASIWNDTIGYSWLTIEAGESPGGGRNHINVDEMNAAIRAAYAAVPGTRQLLLTDSAVVYGVLNKGRGSSQTLLRRCRRFAAAMVVKRGTIVPKWVPSAFNPADAPSRGEGWSPGDNNYEYI
jgi:Reverse transcriptase (RNA-dependent DNA polymerase)